MIINMIEKQIKIPAITADPIAMFFEERKEEAELHEKQTEAAKKAWEALIHQEGFTGFQFKAHRGWTVYFHPSSREGIDWQLSYQGANGEFFSHLDFLEHTDDPKKGWNMRELYRELIPCSQRGREVEVTVLLDERKIEKGIENMAEKRKLTRTEERCISLYDKIYRTNEHTSLWNNVLQNYESTELQNLQQQDSLKMGEAMFPQVAVLQAKNSERHFQDYDEQVMYSSDDYELVFLTADTSPHSEEIKNKLNTIYSEMQEWTMQPHDYYGHTLSVGDILVVEEDVNSNTYQSYLVNSLGFQKLSDDFLKEEMSRKLQNDLDIKKEYLMYRGLETLSIENEEIKRSLNERAGQLRKYEPKFDLAEKRGIIMMGQSKIETIYDYENRVQTKNRLTFPEKIQGQAVLSIDVIKNTTATELRKLLNETYEKVVEENKTRETERLQNINQKMQEIGREFVPSHLEENGTYMYTAKGKSPIILESMDAVEEWITQRNLAWEVDDFLHNLNPYDYKQNTGLSYNGTVQEREMQKEKMLEKIKKGNVVDIAEQLLFTVHILREIIKLSLHI